MATERSLPKALSSLIDDMMKVHDKAGRDGGIAPSLVREWATTLATVVVPVLMQPAPSEPHGTKINHPEHYGGADNPYEAIKVIEACELGFHLGNTFKYIARAGKKGPTEFDGVKEHRWAEIDDLKKARWYLDRHISNLQRLAD